MAATRQRSRSTAALPPTGASLGLRAWAGLADELHDLSRSTRDDKWTAMGGLIDDDVLHTFAVVAEPGGVAVEIRRRFTGLIDRVSFYAPYDLPADAWQPSCTTSRPTPVPSPFL